MSAAENAGNAGNAENISYFDMKKVHWKDKARDDAEEKRGRRNISALTDKEKEELYAQNADYFFESYGNAEKNANAINRLQRTNANPEGRRNIRRQDQFRPDEWADLQRHQKEFQPRTPATAGAATEGTKYFIQENNDIIQKFLSEYNNTSADNVKFNCDLLETIFDNHFNNIPAYEKENGYRRLHTFNAIYEIIKLFRYKIDPETEDPFLIQEMKDREELDETLKTILPHFSPPPKEDRAPSAEEIALEKEIETPFAIIQNGILTRLMDHFSATVSQDYLLEQVNERLGSGIQSGGGGTPQGIPPELLAMAQALAKKAEAQGFTREPVTQAETNELLTAVNIPTQSLAEIKEIKQNLPPLPPLPPLPQKGGAGGTSGSVRSRGLLGFILSALLAVTAPAGSNAGWWWADPPVRPNVVVPSVLPSIAPPSVSASITPSVPTVSALPVPDDGDERYGDDDEEGRGMVPFNPSPVAPPAPAATPLPPIAPRNLAALAGTTTETVSNEIIGAAITLVRKFETQKREGDMFNSAIKYFDPTFTAVAIPTPAPAALIPNANALRNIRPILNSANKVVKSDPQLSLLIRNLGIHRTLAVNTEGGRSPQQVMSSGGSLYDEEQKFEKNGDEGFKGLKDGDVDVKADLQPPTSISEIRDILKHVVLGTKAANGKRLFKILKTRVLVKTHSFATNLYNVLSSATGSSRSDIDNANEVLCVQVFLVNHEEKGFRTSVTIDDLYPLALPFIISPRDMALAIREDGPMRAVYFHMLDPTNQKHFDSQTAFLFAVKTETTGVTPGVLKIVSELKSLTAGSIISHFADNAANSIRDFQTVIKAGSIESKNASSQVAVIPPYQVALAHGAITNLEQGMQLLIRILPDAPTIKNVEESMQIVNATFTDLQLRTSGIDAAIGKAKVIIESVDETLNAAVDVVKVSAKLFRNVVKAYDDIGTTLTSMIPLIAVIIALAGIELIPLASGSLFKTLGAIPSATVQLVAGAGVGAVAAAAASSLKASTGSDTFTPAMQMLGIAAVSTPFLYRCYSGILGKSVAAAGAAGAPPPPPPVQEKIRRVQWWCGNRAADANSNGFKPVRSKPHRGKAAPAVSSSQRRSSEESRRGSSVVSASTFRSYPPDNATAGYKHDEERSRSGSFNSVNSNATVPDTPSSSPSSFPQITLDKASNSPFPIPEKSPFGGTGSPFCANPSARPGAAGQRGATVSRRGPGDAAGPNSFAGVGEYKPPTGRRTGGGYRKTHKARHVTRRVRKLQRRRTTHHKRRVTK